MSWDDGVFEGIPCLDAVQSASADDQQADDFCTWSRNGGARGALGEQSIHCITEPIF